MSYDPRQLLNSFNRLAPRERFLLGAAVLSVVLIGSYSFVWDPLQGSAAQLSKRIEVRDKDLVALEQQREEYLDLLTRIEADQGISETDPNFNLLGLLQTVIGQAVSREHITSMNPSTREVPPDFKEETVEVKLTQVDLQQIVDLMYHIEKGDHPLHFSRVVIKKRFNEPRSFDVVANVSILKKVT